MVAPPGGWGALLVCSELRLDQLPQDATAVRELLGDFTGMRIPLAQPAYDTLMSDSGRRHMKDTFVRSNELNPLLTTLVMERKSLSLTSTELNTSFAVISFFTAVFDTLREYSPVVLSDLLFLNSSERGTSSTSISKGKRPDTLVQVNSTTLLVGEEKPLVGLLFAIEDLRKKIVNLNRSHFGDVPFVLAWAASGSQIQFFIATANDKVSSAACLSRTGLQKNEYSALGVHSEVRSVAAIGFAAVAVLRSPCVVALRLNWPTAKPCWLQLLLEHVSARAGLSHHDAGVYTQLCVEQMLTACCWFIIKMFVFL
eukprot:TRINITY_DN633_c0_g2_i4.p1 TRINITY_DN633_c0_g2~~TRINITY_DN633_c0_g2_i4.p1  ORF type:complete len:312 (+),score=30.99 TRINITY_DN633_c0_g2_i4:1761-2696(+)